MRKSMKALSVKLPWAMLMFPELIKQAGDFNSNYSLQHLVAKNVENRNYSTSWRGTIAIQASKKIEQEEILSAIEFVNSRPRFGPFYIPNKIELQRYAGKIIGVMDIVDCITGPPARDLSKISPWFVGPYGWVLRNPMSLSEPIACRGTISPILWDVPEFALTEINKQLGGKL